MPARDSEEEAAERGVVDAVVGNLRVGSLLLLLLAGGEGSESDDDVSEEDRIRAEELRL